MFNSRGRGLLSISPINKPSKGIPEQGWFRVKGPRVPIKVQKLGSKAFRCSLVDIDRALW